MIRIPKITNSIFEGVGTAEKSPLLKTGSSRSLGGTTSNNSSVPAATSSGNGGARSKEIRSDPNSVEDLSNSVSRLSVRHARSKSTNTGRWKSKY